MSKESKSYTMANVQELTEQELEAVTGGAAPQSWETVVDTADTRLIQEFRMDGSNVKQDGTIKKDFGAGKNPHYKSGGSNVHTVDLTNLK
jgi:bacteriocin-like protein